MVQNRIVKVQKRNRALVKFDADKIRRAILKAGQSIGGLQQDCLPGINEKLFATWTSDESLASFLADAVIVGLNSDEHHLITNFPPTIELVQDTVLHVLRSYGFQNTADAYACYRWGRHWLREGAVSKEQFVGNGFPNAAMSKVLEWNKARGVDTVAGLNEVVKSGKLKGIVEESIGNYAKTLDEAAAKVMARLNKGDKLRMMWVSGPSCSGKTTTTVKLTQRLCQHGLRFLMLNLDDYFWSLVEHPTDWINDRNYETPEAMDIQSVNRHLLQLLEGDTIQKPIYSFKEGRQVATKGIKLEREQILLIDCLHGLYPPLTEGISTSAQFRVYIETDFGLYQNDGAGRKFVGSTEIRVMRRMLRDARHRNYSPLLTLLHWHYVRTGELFSILPLSGLADFTIHTGFAFELAAFKALLCGPGGLLPAQEEFDKYAGFLDAQTRYRKVRELLESVQALTASEVSSYDIIPGDAVTREFIGGSSIKIPHNE